MIVIDPAGDYSLVPFRRSSVISPRSRQVEKAAAPIALGYNSTEHCIAAKLSLTQRFLAVQVLRKQHGSPTRFPSVASTQQFEHSFNYVLLYLGLYPTLSEPVHCLLPAAD